MNYRKKFVVEPGAKVRLAKIDPSYTGKHESHDNALPEIQKSLERMEELQYLLYAVAKRSLLVVLQALRSRPKRNPLTISFGGHIVARPAKAKSLSSIGHIMKTCSR